MDPITYEIVALVGADLAMAESKFWRLLITCIDHERFTITEAIHAVAIAENWHPRPPPTVNERFDRIAYWRRLLNCPPPT